MQEHWFTLRKIGQQWFNLNSLLSGPELISDTYLSLFLTQLEKDGYSIFVVNGILPESQADLALANTRVVQQKKPSLTNSKFFADSEFRGTDGFTEEERLQMASTIADSLSSNAAEEQKQLEAALAMSLSGTVQESAPTTSNHSYMSEDDQLKAALALSLEANLK